MLPLFFACLKIIILRQQAKCKQKTYTSARIFLVAVSNQLPPHSLSPDYESACTGGQKILPAYLAPQKYLPFKKATKCACKMCGCLYTG